MMLWLIDLRLLMWLWGPSDVAVAQVCVAHTLNGAAIQCSLCLAGCICTMLFHFITSCNTKSNNITDNSKITANLAKCTTELIMNCTFQQLHYYHTLWLLTKSVNYWLSVDDHIIAHTALCILAELHWLTHIASMFIYVILGSHLVCTVSLLWRGLTGETDEDEFCVWWQEGKQLLSLGFNWTKWHFLSQCVCNLGFTMNIEYLCFGYSESLLFFQAIAYNKHNLPVYD